MHIKIFCCSVNRTVSKLCLHNVIKRMLTDYFGLYRSGEVMKPKLQINPYDTSSGN